MDVVVTGSSEPSSGCAGSGLASICSKRATAASLRKRERRRSRACRSWPRVARSTAASVRRFAERPPIADTGTCVAPAAGRDEMSLLALEGRMNSAPRSRRRPCLSAPRRRGSGRSHTRSGCTQPARRAPPGPGARARPGSDRPRRWTARRPRWRRRPRGAVPREHRANGRCSGDDLTLGRLATPGVALDDASSRGRPSTLTSAVSSTYEPTAAGPYGVSLYRWRVPGARASSAVGRTIASGFVVRQSGPTVGGGSPTAAVGEPAGADLFSAGSRRSSTRRTRRRRRRRPSRRRSRS